MPAASNPGASRSEALLASLELFGVRLGLERTRRFLRDAGDPHLELPAILIAGTNGKGSTASLLASICHAAGYRCGLYTSPHLESVTERVAIDGRPIDDLRLAGYLEELIEGSRGGEPPTYFEALTIAAFRYFHESRVDLAILEVGLGGRLDATNVSEPVISVITSISLDHEEHLGSTLEAITLEKCGILRKRRPAVAWGGESEVEATLVAEAERVGSDLTLARRRVRWRQVAGAGDPAIASLSLETPVHTYSLKLGLPGLHQIQNAALGILTCEHLASAGWPRLDSTAIREGCRNWSWPGRLESLVRPGGGRVLLDAAHNPDAIAALAAYVGTLGEPPDLLFGAMSDKAVDAMLPAIAAVTRRVTLTRARGARAADPQDLVSLLPGRDCAVEADLARGLDRALAANPPTLLICGSVALAGEVRALLKERGFCSAR